MFVGCAAVHADRAGGQTYGQFQTGALMFTIIVITVHLQLATVTEQWTLGHHLAVWGSIGALREHGGG